MLPYHPQTNGQVEQAHQMLMQMIGKLGKDWKADWPKHLLEWVHAYNSTRSGVTRYSPHYLMFGWWLHLPINICFPTIASTAELHYVNHYIADLCEQLCEAFKEVQVQSTSEAERQRWYYDHKVNAISLELGDLVLDKANVYKGRRKVKDQWKEETYEVECRTAECIPSCLVKNMQTGGSWVLQRNCPFSLPHNGGSLVCRCMGRTDKVHHHHPGRAYSEGKWEWRSTTKCKVSAISPVPDRWDSSRLGQ